MKVVNNHHNKGLGLIIIFFFGLGNREEGWNTAQECSFQESVTP